ncbi:MAG TPA: hypothetical protein VF833_07050, partial [Gaiellaceae bacterium]
MTKRIGVAVGVLATVAVTLVVAASPGSSSPSANRAIPIPALPAPTAFVSRIDNKFFPLEPGTTFRYRGQQDGKPMTVSVSITRKTKLIAGIRASVVLDQVFVGGKPEERTFDWYAQDKRGN